MNRAKERIKSYLEERAKSDEVLAEKMKDESKSIDKCMEFICSEVKKMAGNGDVCLDDDTVYGLAVHYYDEKNVEYEKTDATVVFAGTITEEEKAAIQEEAKRKALERLTEEQVKAYTAKKPAPKKDKEQSSTEQQLSLF